MGPGLAACGLVRHRLGPAAVPRARRRAAADHRLVLRRGAGERRDRTALRCRRRQLFGLVFRAPAADRAGALQRDPAHDRQGSRRRTRARPARHILALASRYSGLRHPNRKEAPGLQGGVEGDRRRCARSSRAGSTPIAPDRTVPRRRWRCIICWNASTTSSATGGWLPATSITAASSTSTRWRDCASRTPAPSRPSIAWSSG